MEHLRNDVSNLVKVVLIYFVTTIIAAAIDKAGTSTLPPEYWGYANTLILLISAFGMSKITNILCTIEQEIIDLVYIMKDKSSTEKENFQLKDSPVYELYKVVQPLMMSLVIVANQSSSFKNSNTVIIVSVVIIFVLEIWKQAELIRIRKTI